MFMGSARALTEGFDDEVFHECVLKAANQKESLTAEQLSGIKVLNCDEYVNSTKGIEKLTNLEELNINLNGDFSGIDLSSNTKLKKLKIYGYSLKEISLTTNTLLEELNLSGTAISNLDLQSNIALKKLILSHSYLKTLNIEKNTELEVLDITNTDISVDLTNNTNLKELYINEKDISKIDLTKLTSLNKLLLTSSYNKLIYINHNEPKGLDETVKNIIPNNITYKDYEYINSEDNKKDIKMEPFNVYSFEILIKEANNSSIKFKNYENLVDMYLITFNIASDKYTIDENSNVIYIGNDSKDNILENIKVDIDKNELGVEPLLKFEINNNELLIKQNSDNEVVKKFTIKTGNAPILKCSEKDGKYFDKNGNSVSKEAYFESCGVVENPKTGLMIPLIMLIIFGMMGISLIIKRKTYFENI